jgi:tRNA-2-methylthio-N6-dimethylallyladenosine synthase
MDEQVPREVVAERYERLVALQDEISWAENRAQVGRSVEVLVASGEGRKDVGTGRLSGRARDGRLVHFRGPDVDASDARAGDDGVPRPGDIVRTTVTRAAPHHLLADEPLVEWRRTRAGDLGVAEMPCSVSTATTRAVGLGLPRVGAPVPTA